MFFKSHELNIISNIKYLFFLFLFFNFILSSLIFFKLLSYKLCIILIISFYFYVFSLLVFNLKKNINIIYFLIFFCAYWLTFFVPGINAHDDLSSYLVFAEKFFDNGSIPEETLSIRRSYSLGGSFIFKGVLSKFDPNYFTLFEPLLGILLISILILSSDISFEKKFLCISFLMFCPFLGSRIVLNTEPVFIMAFFSLAIILLINNYKLKKDNKFIGMLIFFVLIPLLYRPTTFLFNILMLSYFLYFLLSINKNLKNILFNIFTKKNTIIFSLIILIFYPFVMSSFNSAGTLIYPILGKGWQNESEIFSDFPLNYYSKIKNFEDIIYFLKIFFFKNFFLPIIIISGLILYFKEKNNLYLIIVLFYIINCLAISFSIGVSWVLRYSFPVALAILIFFIIVHKEIFNINKKLIHTSYISLMLLGIIIYFIVGKDVNLKRNNSKYLGYNTSLISQISELKNKIYSSDKLLVNSIFGLAIYKSGFKNISIYDTPLVMQPWIKKGKINFEDFDIFEKEFVKYYKSLNFDYFITDHVVYKNQNIFEKLLSNNFKLKYVKELNTPNIHDFKLYVYKIN